jgi:hypothetical protein
MSNENTEQNVISVKASDLNSFLDYVRDVGMSVVSLEVLNSDKSVSDIIKTLEEEIDEISGDRTHVRNIFDDDPLATIPVCSFVEKWYRSVTKAFEDNSAKGLNLRPEDTFNILFEDGVCRTLSGEKLNSLILSLVRNAVVIKVKELLRERPIRIFD